MEVHPAYKKDQIKIAIGAIILSLAAIAVMAFVDFYAGLGVLAGIWILALIAMKGAAQNKQFITLIIDDEQVSLKSGILSSKTEIINYSSITDFDINRDFFDNILGTASIEIDTAGTTGIELQASGIPMKYVDELASKIRKRESKKG